jgi:SAM-dependent methyltransferase
MSHRRRAQTKGPPVNSVVSEQTVESGPDNYQQALLDLYDKSLLKQAKYRAIKTYLPETSQKVCLDIGADNGVLSYLLRERGGHWHSADLDESVVEGITRMVGARVHQFDGGRTEFPNDHFDIVVIIDFLEHIVQDRFFIEELYRITSPGGRIIINVPHARPDAWIRRLRLRTGLTDEKHGHVRPGYTLESLGELLDSQFRIQQSHTYSRFFVELFDVAVSLLFERMSRGGESKKGVVVTGDDLERHARKFRMFRLVYPVVWLLAQLDKLLFFMPGYSLIVQAQKIDGS